MSIATPDYLALAEACDRAASVVDGVICDDQWPGVVRSPESKAEMAAGARKPR